jgi:hypothetical protein
MKIFLVKLRYLFDIFEKLNALNLSLQGSNMHPLKSLEKIFAFMKKVKLWKRKINEDGGKESFSLLQQFFTSNGVDFSRGMKSIFEEHLSHLITWFEKYFKVIISINLHRFEIHLMPLLHLNLLLQETRI